MIATLDETLSSELLISQHQDQDEDQDQDQDHEFLIVIHIPVHQLSKSLLD